MEVILAILFLTEMEIKAVDFYVSVETGSDSSDGSSATVGSGSVRPSATIAHAVDTIGTLKNRSYMAYIIIPP